MGAKAMSIFSSLCSLLDPAEWRIIIHLPTSLQILAVSESAFRSTCDRASSP